MSMNEILFAEDISWTGQRGEQHIFHVRGRSWEEFQTNRDLCVDITGNTTLQESGPCRAEFTPSQCGECLNGRPCAVHAGKGQTETERTANPPRPVHQAAKDAPAVCPDHGNSSPSKFGGVYCTAKTSESEFCKWKWGAKKVATA